MRRKIEVAEHDERAHAVAQLRLERRKHAAAEGKRLVDRAAGAVVRAQVDGAQREEQPR